MSPVRTVGTFRPTIAEIDLDAIRHNVHALTPPGVEALAVVKADGYGHGAVEVARAALEAGATWLGVALVEEGLELRDAGIEAPVLTLSDWPEGSEREGLAAGITPTVSTERAVRALAGAAQELGHRPGVHVKVDTGMHRAGVHPPEATLTVVDLLAGVGLEFEGLWTHFAKAEEDPQTTQAQLARFQEIREGLERAGHRPRLLHAANSAAAMLHPQTHLDLVRLGIAMYGLPPGPGVDVSAGLRPALTWHSRVSFVRRLASGEAVSYGHRYRLGRDATVATVPVGYADGYPRILSSRSDVLIGGRRRRVAGNVTMDQLMVDCADDPVEPGDEVVLIGAQGDEAITAQELAELAGTIGYEIVCGIGPRVPRRYRGLGS